MPEHEEAPAATPDPRVSTGCTPLDQMLSGGLVPRRPYLIVGPSGTGKTTLALQFLCEGIRRGEQCLVVTLEEPPNEIRANHRNLAPELDDVYVFDAIPDVMRYERAPFKDIAAVRQSVRFREVPYAIRQSPELASIEVTFTALEQTLKMEMARRKYSRMVIDSLTALQYFCMKGFDETLGAQTFLRFLSDLHVTTLLTVEAPLEDVESPERLLARGEIRLFRWELDSRTVRAIGVEKFRGSPHDTTLHPYRISPRGLDINLDVTISRDTRKLQSPTGELVAPVAPPPAVEEFATGLAALDQDCQDLVELAADAEPVRAALIDALAAARGGDALGVARAVVRARGRVLEAADQLRTEEPSLPDSPPLRRLLARASAARTGVPPFTVPDPGSVQPIVESMLRTLEVARPIPPPAPSPVAATVVATTPAPPLAVPPAVLLPSGVPPVVAQPPAALPSAPLRTPEPIAAGQSPAVADPAPMPAALPPPPPPPPTSPPPPPPSSVPPRPPPETPRPHVPFPPVSLSEPHAPMRAVPPTPKPSVFAASTEAPPPLPTPVATVPEPPPAPRSAAPPPVPESPPPPASGNAPSLARPPSVHTAPPLPARPLEPPRAVVPPAAQSVVPEPVGGPALGVSTPEPAEAPVPAVKKRRRGTTVDPPKKRSSRVAKTVPPPAATSEDTPRVAAPAPEGTAPAASPEPVAVPRAEPVVRRKRTPRRKSPTAGATVDAAAAVETSVRTADAPASPAPSLPPPEA